MGERYEFWTHQQSGETWTGRVNERGLVVTCCGPLERAKLHRSELPRLVYDPRTRRLAQLACRRVHHSGRCGVSTPGRDAARPDRGPDINARRTCSRKRASLL